MTERELIHHLETRPEVCVTFTKDIEEKGYPVYHFFPLEFIEGKQPCETRLYQVVMNVTHRSASAIAAVKWALKAKKGDERKTKALHMTMD